MAANPLIPNRYVQDDCNVVPAIVYVTKVPITLNLFYWTVKPSRQPVLKKVRGHWMRCGFRVDCTGSTRVRDGNTQPDTFHVFYLPDADPGDLLWYVISDYGNPCTALRTTPLLLFKYPSCPSTGDQIRVRNIGGQGAASNPTLIYDAVISGNPALWVFPTKIEVPATGLYEVKATGTISEFVGGAQLLDLEFVSDDLGVFNTQFYNLPNNGSIAYVLGGLFHFNVNDRLSVRCTSNLGSGAWVFRETLLPLITSMKRVA